MPCLAFMCNGAADCADLDCPGHPHGAAAYLDKQDREALAQIANTQVSSFWPRDAQITVDSWPLLDKAPANCVERWAVRCFWLVVAGCVGWALYANWPMLRWALGA